MKKRNFKLRLTVFFILLSTQFAFAASKTEPLHPQNINIDLSDYARTITLEYNDDNSVLSCKIQNINFKKNIPLKNDTLTVYCTFVSNVNFSNLECELYSDNTTYGKQKLNNQSSKNKTFESSAIFSLSSDLQDKINVRLVFDNNNFDKKPWIQLKTAKIPKENKNIAQDKKEDKTENDANNKNELSELSSQSNENASNQSVEQNANSQDATTDKTTDSKWTLKIKKNKKDNLTDTSSIKENSTENKNKKDEDFEKDEDFAKDNFDNSSQNIKKTHDNLFTYQKNKKQNKKNVNSNDETNTSAEIELPTDVQSFIQNTTADKNSWYICKTKGNSKAGEVTSGPFKTREQAVLVWIYKNIPEQNLNCIAKNLLFVTATPSSFFKTLYAQLQEEIKLYGNKQVFDKYFYDIEFNGIISQEQLKTENKPTEKTEYSANIQTTKDNQNNSGKKSEEAKTNQQKPSNQTNIQDNTSKKKTPSDNTIQNDLNSLKKEPSNKKPFTEQTVDIPRITQENNQPTLNNHETEKTMPEKKDYIPSTPSTSTFEFSIDSDSQKQYSTYEKEYLQDYAPKKKPQLPQETVSEKSIDNPNEADAFGRTLLMKAAKNGNNWEIKSLIAAGANVNLKDNDGWTALMYAARYQENISIIEALISAGASVKTKNTYNLSALILASTYNGNPEIIKKLLSFYSVSEKEVIQSFVLLLTDNSATDFAKIAKIEEFLYKSVPLNTFYNGKTPLMYAAQYSSSTKIIKRLMEAGASTSIRSTEGKTAFDYAQENNMLSHDDIYWSLNKK